MKRFALSLLALVPLLAFGATATQAALSWTAPTANTDGSPISGAVTYNLYQGLTGALKPVQSGLSGAAATVTTGLAAGSTQCFAVTAVSNGVESAKSTQACAAIPYPSPGAPNTVVVVIS